MVYPGCSLGLTIQPKGGGHTWENLSPVSLNCLVWNGDRSGGMTVNERLKTSMNEQK